MKNIPFQYEILSDEIFLSTYGGKITAETSLMYDLGYVIGALVTSLGCSYSLNSAIAVFPCFF
jgi:hypothetical protein